MGIEVYGIPESGRVKLARIVAAAEKVDITFKPVDRANKSAEFIELFPQGKVPGLVDGEMKISEVIAVCYYLASVNRSVTTSGSLLQTAKNAIGFGGQSLMGSTVAEEAAVLQWMSWANHELMLSLGAWMAQIFGREGYNKKAESDADAKTNKCLAYLNDILLHRTYLASERLTLADIFVAAFIMRGSEVVFDKEIRAAYPNVWRHYNTVANQPWFKTTAFGGAEVPLLDKRQAYTPPAKEAKPKAEKPAAAPAAPKAEKAPKAKKPAADDEEEDDTPKEVKPKHPIETLGPAKSFPLDEWKRQYSNLDTPEALKWFEEHYDPQDYSLWHAVYKYPSELTQVFMSSNLITGFHTRLEASRKFLFGNAGVYGKANDSTIQGVYMVRGSNGMHAFEVAPDAESYEFTPLDYKNPEHRKLLEDVWKWEGEMEGRTFADGKTFK